MIQLIRNNNPYTVIILLIFTLIVKMQALVSPQLPEVPVDNVLYYVVFDIFNSVLNGNAFGFTMVAVIMLFLQALFLNAVVLKHRMFAKPTYIPAFLYLLLTSLHPSFSYFGIPLLVNWCILIGLNMLLTFHQTQHPRKQVFNAAFTLCIAALFHFPAVYYFALLFITLLLLRPFSAGEWVVGVMGYLTPIYFYTSLLFLIDRLGVIKSWPHLSLHLPSKLPSPVYLSGAIGGVLVLFLAGLLVLKAQMAKSNVFTRRSWVIILLFVLISLLVGISTHISMQNIWLLAMPALSLIISHVLYLEKRKRFSNFAFYFSLLLVLFCQLALNN